MTMQEAYREFRTITDRLRQLLGEYSSLKSRGNLLPVTEHRRRLDVLHVDRNRLVSLAREVAKQHDQFRPALEQVCIPELQKIAKEVEEYVKVREQP